MRPEKIQTVALPRGFDSRHLHELPKVVHLTSANAVRRVPAGYPAWRRASERLVLVDEDCRPV
jgi:hypothetical protein